MTTTTSTPYPVHVDAATDPHASRALWLVKWLLARPHYLVLVVLWIASVVLSLVALVTIVVTGRYPRPLVEFNVGVLLAPARGWSAKGPPSGRSGAEG